MGSYLPKPIKDKGWRMTQEDACVVAIGGMDIPQDLNIFGVFDGHGGMAVSAWVAKNYVRILKAMLVSEGLSLDKNVSTSASSEAELKSKISRVLIKTFHRLDIEMKTRRQRIDIGLIDAKAKKEKESGSQHHKYTLEEERERCAEKFRVNKPEERVVEALDELTDPSTLLHTGSKKHATPESCGCTAVVTAIVGGPSPRLFVGNLGDSRSVLSENGTCIDLTVDHKPDDDREHQRIIEAEGFLRDGRVDGCLNLSRALGDHEYKQTYSKPWYRQKISALPDVTTIPLTQNSEFVVVGCDGLWELMTPQEVVDQTKRLLTVHVDESGKPNLKKVSESLCDLACKPEGVGSTGIGMDNITAMVIYFGTEAERKQKFKPAASAGPIVEYTFGNPNEGADGTPSFITTAAVY